MGSLSNVKQTKVTSLLDRFIHLGLSLEEFELALEDSGCAQVVVTTWKEYAAKKGVLAVAPRPRRRRKLPARPLTEAERSDWEAFYRDVLKVEVDLSGVIVPAHRKELNRVLVVAEGVTMNAAWAACQARFSCYSDFGDDLDKVITENDRTATQSYAVCVRDVVEADECWKETSAETLSQKKVSTITLLERLGYELKCFEETGGHLDIANMTLCAASRSSGGGVVGVSWRGGRLYVRRCDPRDAFPGLRAREVAVS